MFKLVIIEALKNCVFNHLIALLMLFFYDYYYYNLSLFVLNIFIFNFVLFIIFQYDFTLLLSLNDVMLLALIFQDISTTKKKEEKS